MIKVNSFQFNPFQENTYLLHDETREALIIDAGCYDKEEREELISFIEINNLKVLKLINTHSHVDHVLGCAFVKDYYNVQLGIHKLDEPTLRSVKVYAPTYGFVYYEDATADYFIEEGEKIKFGNSELEVLFVPGHAPGHIALVNRDQKLCISGDVLFHRSIGRTDLPGGDFNTLIKSIKEKIFPLGNDMLVYPGHGPSTTVGDEIKNNPFLK